MNDNLNHILIETIIKLAAINKLLVKKGILTDQDVQDEMTQISKDLIQQLQTVLPSVFDKTSQN